MKDYEMFMEAMKTAQGPVFEIQCDPRGSGCGKSTTEKTQRPVQQS